MAPQLPPTLARGVLAQQCSPRPLPEPDRPTLKNEPTEALGPAGRDFACRRTLVYVLMRVVAWL